MNRRTVLGLGGTVAITGLAGCLDGLREHFGLQGVIPVEIHSESERTHNVHLEAREPEADRQSYEESYSVTPGETVSAPHLNEVEQNLRVATIEDDSMATVRAVTVTPDVDLVLVRLYDDDLEVELEYEDGESEIEDGEDDSDEPDGSDGNETDADGSDDENGTAESEAGNESDAEPSDE